ncbi:reverse transcriptase domain-containing protein [Tanacetum coccineum]|uniref:Reverse transcriptase domain-containing protein n=1 Tax=Tanacetum coccineum TaxID=301880 RepID=A0ABQ5D2P5_9ASTR
MDDEPMWLSTMLSLDLLVPRITILETTKRIAFQRICDMFKYRDTENEAVRLMMFPLSLTGEAKTWLDELNEGTIKTWDELRTAFISRFFPPALFDRLLGEIRAFSQHENESLTDAWLRMKEMLRNCHGHNLSKGNIIKIFYHGLSEITQEVLNAAAGGIFLYKTPNQAYQLLEDKVVFTRSGKSYNPTVNQNDQQNDSETTINFDSDDEEEEPTPQPNPKPVKETQLPKPYKPKIPYPQRLRKEKMEAQYGKFLNMIRAVRINVPLIDVLAGMPNYGKFLKELISNKHKIKQIFAAFLSNESLAMIQNKVPPKLGDPGSFLIPCNFNKTFSCNALADLGASINLMPSSLHAKLSLETLKPTKISVRLADRSFQYPVGIAENLLVEVGKFTFPADFVILEIEEDNVIDEVFEEGFNALLDEGSKILHSIKGTLLEEEIFAEFDEFIAMTTDENSNSESKIEDPPFEKITINTDYKIKTSLEEPHTDLELKPLPDNLEYVFLKEPFFLLVIHLISAYDNVKRKTNLYPSLKSTSKPLLGKLLTFLVFAHHSANTRYNFLMIRNPLSKNKEDAHLVLNWKKCHVMVKEGIVLGHKVSSVGLEVDKAKIDVISKLLPPTNIKDHSALRHLFKKQDAKPRLIRWILLLQEFDIEIKDRKGTENVVADHLSRIENDDSSDDSEVDDNFPGETLMEINTKNEPWFADFANYLVGDIIPKGMTYQRKNKFFSGLKHYFWEEPYLFKVSTSQQSSRKLLLQFAYVKHGKRQEIYQNEMRCP